MRFSVSRGLSSPLFHFGWIGLLAVAINSSLGGTLTSGQGGLFFTTNTNGTSNGLPTGGFINGSPGFGINDAAISVQSDAYDIGGVLYINNSIFVAPAIVETSTSSDSSVGVLAGLDVRVRYQTLPSTATLRSLATLANPTATTIVITATFVTNYGSDGGTVILATGSGDTSLSLNDRYVISDDSSTTSGDPTNTIYLFGPGNPLETPTAISGTVFAASNTQGLLAEFRLEIPAFATQSLLFFMQLNPNASSALAEVPLFDTQLVFGDERTAGMTQAEFNSIVNWQVGGTAVIPEPLSLTMWGLVLGGLATRSLVRRKPSLVQREAQWTEL